MWVFLPNFVSWLSNIIGPCLYARSLFRSLSFSLPSFTCSDAAQWIGCKFYPAIRNRDFDVATNREIGLMTFLWLSSERKCCQDRIVLQLDGAQHHWEVKMCAPMYLGQHFNPIRMLSSHTRLYGCDYDLLTTWVCLLHIHMYRAFWKNCESY